MSLSSPLEGTDNPRGLHRGRVIALRRSVGPRKGTRELPNHGQATPKGLSPRSHPFSPVGWAPRKQAGVLRSKSPVPATRRRRARLGVRPGTRSAGRAGPRALRCPAAPPYSPTICVLRWLPPRQVVPFRGHSHSTSFTNLSRKRVCSGAGLTRQLRLGARL